MKLNLESVKSAIESMRGNVNLGAEELAEGIIDVANTNMERILRVITVERGHDPANYTLVAFGGAGGLHAADLAERLGSDCVMVPRHAGAISALGAALTDMTRNLTQTILLDEETASEEKIDPIFDQLAGDGKAQFGEDGIDAGSAEIERYLFIRYKGQSYELQLPFKGSLTEAFQQFDELHERYYGFRRENHPREIVNLFVRLTVTTAKPEFPKLPEVANSDRAGDMGKALMYYRGSQCDIKLLDRQYLTTGTVIHEPAIIFEATATTLLPPGWSGKVDEYGNLIMKKN